ncbi:MAG: 50S ribosomal protein L14e [archaeon]
MALLEIGRVCLKSAGRKAGTKVVIVDFTEKGEPVIEGETVKRKKANARHIFPTDKKIGISKAASREEIVRQLKQVQLK